MCFSKPKVDTTVPKPVERDEKASLAQEARITALRAGGVRDTIATSPLGDPNFGANAVKPRATKLGQTNAGM